MKHPQIPNAIFARLPNKCLGKEGARPSNPQEVNAAAPQWTFDNVSSITTFQQQRDTYQEHSKTNDSVITLGFRAWWSTQWAAQSLLSHDVLLFVFYLEGGLEVIME